MLWSFWVVGCTWGKLWACEAKHRWKSTSSMNQEINFSNIHGILSCNAADLPVFCSCTAFVLIVGVMLDCNAWGGYFSVQLVATCWLRFLSPGVWRREIRVFCWYLGFSCSGEFKTFVQSGGTLGIWKLVCLKLFAATEFRPLNFSTSFGWFRITPTFVSLWLT